MGLYDYAAFKECVANVLALSGYSVESNVQIESGMSDIDIVASKEGTCFFC